MNIESFFIRAVLSVSGIAFWIIAICIPALAIVLTQYSGFDEEILWGEVVKVVVPLALLGTLNIALAIREFRRSKVLK